MVVSQEYTQLQQLRCKIPLYESKNQTPTEYAYARHFNLLETCEKWSMPAAPKKGSQNRSTRSFAKNVFFVWGFYVGGNFFFWLVAT